MRKKIRARLSSRSGESLSEVLIALVVSSLALVMLASMVNTTNDIVNRSKEVVKTYVEQNNTLVAKASNDGNGQGNGDGADNSTFEGSAVFKIKSGTQMNEIKLTEEQTARTIALKFFVNRTLNSVEVTSYKKGGGS